MNLKPNSRSLYRFVLDKVSKKHGHRLVRDMPQHKGRKIIEEIGETRPGMANLTRAVLHKFMAHAIKSGWRGRQSDQRHRNL